ncbi:hypothetical protein OG889_30935 [Streptomyces sp. NBC_00481]|uniref:hypothetical protein n=1 Tax=unclassified Streptomyces TaxID=2593676 RepID=UPI002DDA744C|nr:MULTISPECIES: hypothetical protein [unclassified Streptomyces]WRZ01811.1 hypothetical protein OG889_30935 [Streptomyces sp. NBC_00481]
MPRRAISGFTPRSFREYGNFGPGAGTGSESPQLTAAEAAEYTAQKYLAGTDGWNPIGV